MKPNPTQTLVAFCLLLAFCCLLPSAVFAQTTDVLPQGLWKVAQITIEKNTDGKLETTVYNTVAEVQSHIPCPQELEVNAEIAVLRYFDDWEEAAEYALEGDELIIYTASGVQKYRYSIQDGNLILIAAYNYVNNDLQAKRSENITEERTIILKK